MGEYGNLFVQRVCQIEDGRAHDQHGHRSGAHNDEQAFEGFAALLLVRAPIGRHQVGEHFDAGHHRQNAHIATQSEVKILGGKGQ